MGIRHLQTFMTTFVPDGYIEVSIIDECMEFQRNNNGQKPTLVFDLMGFASLLNKNLVDMFYGGRHGEYKKILDKLFGRLSSVADLVFFEDGPVMPDKYDTWMKRQDDKYQRTIEVLDQIYSGEPIQEIASKGRDMPSVTTHLDLVENRAAFYGKLIVTVTKECDAELAQYACQNPAVIAVFADDTDFLIFGGSWRYFSIFQINLETLTTKEFSRKALRNYLNLNDKQLIIFSTIAGNDVIKYDEVRRCHQQNFGGNDADVKFPAIARYIRENIDIKNFEGMVYHLAGLLFRSESQYAKDLVYNSICFYNITFATADQQPSSALLNFCRLKKFDFVYAILQLMPKNLTSSYYDFRRHDWPEIFKVMLNLFRRNIGVILQHRIRDNVIYTFYSKKLDRQSYRQHSTRPVYPQIEVPPLIELLDHDNYPHHENVRIALLKWTISERSINADLSGIPKTYLLNVLTLFYMVQEGFIKVREADLILLTIKHEILEMIPENLQYPPVVDERAFRISFLFCHVFKGLARSMELCGLSHLSNYLVYDGVLFHKLYLDFSISQIDPAALLAEIDHYRIYKNLV